MPLVITTNKDEYTITWKKVKLFIIVQSSRLILKYNIRYLVTGSHNRATDAPLGGPVVRN